MKTFWGLVRVLTAALVGYELAHSFDVSVWAIFSGYLLGAAHIHLAHMAEIAAWEKHFGVDEEGRE